MSEKIISNVKTEHEETCQDYEVQCLGGKHVFLQNGRIIMDSICPLISHKVPVDMLLFCPRCDFQHVDKAEPDVCETCGKNFQSHEFASVVLDKPCESFTAWLNPPHKSHRCHTCNYVWRPADIPTNGIAAIRTKGENDGTANPKEVQM